MEVSFTEPNGSLARQLSARLHGQFENGGLVRGSPDLDVTGFKLGSLRMPGARLSHLDLLGTDVRGSDFTQIKATMVSFASTNLSGADLTGAQFENCWFRGANLENARLNGTRFDGCDLRGAKFARASLQRVRFSACALGTADFEEADISRSLFHQCSLDQARFVGATIERVLMPRCSVNDVEVTGAKRFYRTRELVGEVLRRTAEGDAERLRIALLAAHKTDWCWDAWKEIEQESDVLLRTWAHDVFAQYPDSGMAEALEAGLANDS